MPDETGLPGAPDDVVEERSSDPYAPTPEATRGPIDYADSEESGAPDIPRHLGDPTRRKHPTIFSEEGQEEAPRTELPGRQGPA